MKRILNNFCLAGISSILGAFICAEVYTEFTWVAVAAVGVGIIMCNMPIQPKSEKKEEQKTEE